jgi:hypothetical protein
MGGNQASVLNILGVGADLPLGAESGAGADSGRQGAMDLLSDS